MSMRVCFCALVLLTAMGGSTEARIVRVPIEWPTIQAAIDAASSGDTVLVSEGTYLGEGNRDLDFTGKSIVLLAESGPSSTTIDCGRAGRALYFGSGEDTLSVVSGFTIKRGLATDGGAVLCDGASPKFIDMVFIDNWATSGSGSSLGGGVACLGGAPVFLHCAFRQNRAFASHSGGGGLGCSSSSATLRGCRFQENYAGSGSGILCYGGSPLVLDCVFEGGDGKNVFVSSRPTLTRCIFQFVSGGALELAYSVSLVEDCLFTGNTLPAQCATVYVHGAFYSATFERCTFTDNVGSEGSRGGALWCYDANVTMSQCDFIGNRASMGGVAYCYNGHAIFSNCTIYGNSSPEGAAVYATFGSSVQFTSSIIAFNEGVPVRGSSVVTLECADVYGNTGGDWVGSIASQFGQSGNLCADPLFCSTAPRDLSLRSDSPCGPGAQPSCGLIGAHGIGCPTAMGRTSWGAIKAMYR